LQEDPNLFNILREKGIVVTEKNFQAICNNYKERMSHIFNGISVHIITPTLRCNQKCGYCHANSRNIDEIQYDMDEETAKSVINFAFQTPSSIINIEFQGGEPLLNFDIIKFIVEYAKDKNKSMSADNFSMHNGTKNLFFQMTSNFTLMDEEKADYIIKNSIRLCSSLDGPKELHDKNRKYLGGGGTYDDVVKWMDFFIKDKKYAYFNAALPTITKSSLSYPKEIVEEYISRGFSHMRARPLLVMGQTIKNWDVVGYTAEEFNSFWDKYMEAILEKNRNGIYFWDEDAIMFLRRMMATRPMDHACLNKPCGAGTIQCAYNQFGDIYICDGARSNDTFKIGNVKTDSYEDVFTSDAVAGMIGISSGVSLLCDSCPWNAFCAPCVICTYGSQGNIVPKLSTDFLCKIRKHQVKYLFEKILFSEDKDIIINWFNRYYNNRRLI
jgi:His-Xaa-Ser system radical SAM maturase HxsB